MDIHDLGTTGLSCHRPHKTRITAASVIGERSSGTNFCSFLLRTNFGLPEASATGWKHGIGTNFVAVPRTHLFVVCLREAIDWTRSMYAKPWHCAEHMFADGFSHFIRAPWDTRVDRFVMRNFKLNPKPRFAGNPLTLDRHPVTGEMFRDIRELRSVKARSFLALRGLEVNVAYVRLEALQQDPAALLDGLASAYALSRPRDYTFTDRTMGQFRSAELEPRRIEVAEISDEDRAFLDAGFDAELEHEMGYGARGSLIAPLAEGRPASS